MPGYIQKNRRRFQQASSTPFFTSPLVNLIDTSAAGPFAQAARDGHYIEPEGIDEATSLLLQALHRSPATRMMSMSISLEEYQTRWHRAREFTATGFSQLHFGHFKASTRYSHIAQFELEMMLLPFQYGFSPSRRRYDLDIALPKNGQ